ncbi:MAG: J domain-containing protein [Calditrichaeota bacterium]|nr:MAG: J domain-containing protein [Calditrichota bacterium]
MKDYYAILKVNPKSSIEEIKKAYRRLAKLYHPDKKEHEGSEVNEERFKEISEAYQILSHPEKRKEYDKKLAREKEAQAWRQRGFGGTTVAEVFGFRPFSPPSLQADIILTREECEEGGSVPIYVPFNIECPRCWGMGMSFFSVCPNCQGRGTVQYGVRIQVQIPGNIYHGQRVQYRIPGPFGFDEIVEFRFLIE